MLIDTSTAVSAWAFAGLVGIAFGLYPAIRASRLDPIVGTAVRVKAAADRGEAGSKRCMPMPPSTAIVPMSDRLIPSAQLYVKLLHVRIAARVMLIGR